MKAVRENSTNPVRTPAFTPAHYASVYASDNADVERQRLRQRLSQIEALQGVYFEGMAMIRPLRKKALFQGVFEAN
jgi:hypothetical protein